MIFSLDNVKRIELGLINSCILKCPMCLRFEVHSENLVNGVFLNFDTVVQVLDQFKNLTKMDLVGSVSEPLLYPDFLKLIDYAKSRNISLKISTNGNVKDKKFWKALGEKLKPADIIRFAIDGSTQEIHQIYRVGGSLSRVLENHAELKSNSGATTVLQFIIFEHNKDDLGNVEKLFIENGFNILEKIESGESVTKTDDGVVPRTELQERYEKLKEMTMRNQLANFDCFAKKNDQIYINHLGNVLPCDDHEEFAFESSKNPLAERIPNIYNNTLDECMDFINLMVRKRFLDQTCFRCCSSEAQKIKEDFPVLQCGTDLKYKKLGEFRGVVSVK